MAKKSISALGIGPPSFINIPVSATPHTIEALRAVINKIAEMVEAEAQIQTFTNIECLTRNPFDEILWDIDVTIAPDKATNLGGTFTLNFVSETTAYATVTTAPIGRPGLSQRRPITFVIATQTTDDFTTTSLTALTGYIELIEDLVAESQVGTTGDISSEAVTATGDTPFGQYVWTLTKADGVYTAVPTSSS